MFNSSAIELSVLPRESETRPAKDLGRIYSLTEQLSLSLRRLLMIRQVGSLSYSKRCEETVRCKNVVPCPPQVLPP